MTPISRPGIALTSAAPAQRLTAATVNFNTTKGADQYVFEFATDPTFRKKVSSDILRFPYTQGVASTTTVNIGTRLGTLADATRVYYRVGARSSIDEKAPINRDAPNGGDFVYSADQSYFEVTAEPPPPPSSGKGKTI